MPETDLNMTSTGTGINKSDDAFGERGFKFENHAVLCKINGRLYRRACVKAKPMFKRHQLPGKGPPTEIGDSCTLIKDTEPGFNARSVIESFVVVNGYFIHVQNRSMRGG